MFVVAIDWIMKTTTKKPRRTWTLWSQLDDLDFADDLALLSHSHEQMQEKTDLLNLVSAQTGRNINMNNTKIMKANTKSNNVVTVGGKPLEETDCFTYLGNKINKTGDAEEEIKARIQKARVAFLMMSKIWKSKLLKTNMRIFNSSVKSILLYSSETWKITKHTVNKMQTFVNRCLQRIVNVKWSDKVSNNILFMNQDQLKKKNCKCYSILGNVNVYTQGLETLA